MKHKKLYLLSLTILPLLMACASPITPEVAITTIDNIVSKLEDPTYKAPTRFQLIYTSAKDYLKSDDYKNEKHVFVCDNESYKIYSSLIIDSNIDGKKTNKTDTLWNWIDNDWTFHSAFQNETDKSHNSQQMNKEAAIVMFNKFAATVTNPALITKGLLKLTSAYLKQENHENYNFQFKSSGEGNITINRETLKFEDVDTRTVHEIKVEIKNNLIYRGYQIQQDKEIREEINFEFTIGNVSVNLPDLSLY